MDNETSRQLAAGQQDTQAKPRDIMCIPQKQAAEAQIAPKRRAYTALSTLVGVFPESRRYLQTAALLHARIVPSRIS